jgi:hypothetical protein
VDTGVERAVAASEERGVAASDGAVLVITLTKKQAVAIVPLSLDLREGATSYFLVKPPPSLGCTALGQSCPHLSHVLST